MKRLIAFLLAVILTTMLSANNITVTNVQLTGQNTTSDFALVQFDISWDNSWRTSSAPNNWDAAWVFVKYRVLAASGGDGLWHHAWLNDAGHTTPSGSIIDIGFLTPATAFNSTTNPGLGAFIYRSADGTGTFTKTGAQLRWNYGVNYKTGSTPISDNDIIDIQVYAIEMVYVPTGSFYAGDGATSGIAGQFNDYNSTSAFQITSESVPATLGGSASGNMRNNNGSGMNYAPSDDFDNSTTKSLPAAFPKGYNAFYCMKYEISQQGYVDFLNTLTYTQQVTRTNNAVPPDSDAGSYVYPTQNDRNKIKISTSGTNNTVPAIYTSDLPYVTMSAFSWADLAAYLDWSGLRPMTELEFEKSCRGTLAPVPNEYAWGNTNLATSAYTISNSGASNEVIATNYDLTYGNAAWGTTYNQPIRVGIFAGTSGNTGRITAGATYYGIMEMSGNTMERTVTVGNTTGRAFTGTHGDGNLNATGDANASAWPGTDAVGAGSRGGTFQESISTYLRVSNRYYASFSYGVRHSYHCGRGVRNAPFVIGQSYGGGIIFYIDGTGKHGLIAATSDQSSGLGIEWITGGSTQSTLNNNTSTAYGTGQANTNYMIAQTGYTGGAAQVCDAYSVTVDGVTYSDWYLPSKDELNLLYLQYVAVGGFVTNNDYWSSSESGQWYAWVQLLTTGGTQNSNNKDAINPVRAIRSF